MDGIGYNEVMEGRKAAIGRTCSEHEICKNEHVGACVRQVTHGSRGHPRACGSLAAQVSTLAKTSCLHDRHVRTSRAKYKGAALKAAWDTWDTQT